MKVKVKIPRRCYAQQSHSASWGHYPLMLYRVPCYQPLPWLWLRTFFVTPSVQGITHNEQAKNVQATQNSSSTRGREKTSSHPHRAQNRHFPVQQLKATTVTMPLKYIYMLHTNARAAPASHTSISPPPHFPWRSDGGFWKPRSRTESQ